MSKVLGRPESSKQHAAAGRVMQCVGLLSLMLGWNITLLKEAGTMAQAAVAAASVGVVYLVGKERSLW